MNMYDSGYACSEQYGGDFFGYRTSGSKSFQVGFSLRVNESTEGAVPIAVGNMFSHEGYYLGKVCPVLHLANFCYLILLLPT